MQKSYNNNNNIYDDDNIIPYDAISVSQLNESIQNIFASCFYHVVVIGEIANVHIHNTEHLYISLKDSKSNLEAVYWNWKPQFGIIEKGQMIVCWGKVTAYLAKSRYQLSIAKYHAFGRGSIFQTFQELQNKLRMLGIFETSKKKPIPTLPYNIALIVSSYGIILEDILQNLHQKCPVNIFTKKIIISGPKAREQIIENINFFNTNIITSFVTSKNISSSNMSSLQNYQIESPDLTDMDHNKVDIIVIARGGGDISEFDVFNEESVVHAISNSKIPIITALGHAANNTLSDIASDYCAITPTAVADIIFKNKAQYHIKILQIKNNITLLMRNLFDNKLQMIQEKRILIKNYLHDLISQYEERLFNIRAFLQQHKYIAYKALPYIMQNGKRIVLARDLQKQQPIQIIFNDGQIDCIVNQSL